MKVNFTEAAKERLARYLDSDKRILLDFDDGVGPFSKVGACSLDGAFRLILVDKDEVLPDFEKVISSNIGDIAIKGYSEAQLDDEMEVRFNKQYFTMPLVSDKRTLTDNLEIIDLSKNADFANVSFKAHDC